MKAENRFLSLFPAGRCAILDGAMGTQLQERGLAPGEIPELWNLDRPGDVRSVHEAYFAAGAHAVYANTFGANAAKYHGRAPLEDVVAAGVGLAREAAASAGPGRLVALDVGPTGRLLAPAGDFAFDAAYDAFAAQISAGAAAGADFIAVETMSDAYELKAAVLAAKENSTLPVLATVALGEDGKLLTGADVECVAAILEGLRADAIGLNCGFGPDRMLEYVRRLAAAVSLPLAVKPNAGLPEIRNGETFFPLGSEEFARQTAALVEAGAAAAGGCCGTSPAHIAALSAALRGVAPAARETARRCVVASGVKAVEIPLDDSVVIGERINPTGKKRLRKALEEGDRAYILREAVAQEEAGAQILDVNTGVPGLDEAATLDSVVQAVQSVSALPLQIDTSDVSALERALRHYNGKALVNSVNGKEESMAAVLPLVAKYGGAAVALTLDESGIPATAEGRFEIARRIVERGAEYGLGPEDFVVDALSMAVSAGGDGANVALRAMSLVRERLGCRTCLGVSNISFGLPARPLVNAAFYTMALSAGLSAGIINPLSGEMMAAWRAWRALAGKDAAFAGWIGAYSGWTPQSPAASAGGPRPAQGGDAASGLHGSIKRGLKEDAKAAAAAMISAGAPPLDVVNSAIVPALEETGREFEAGRMFLPQLLMAAEAAGAAFEAVKAAMPAQGAEAVRGPVVLATVKGDIHDIGKNICRALLENYGFKVIDLGRDVAPETVAEAAVRENARIVGLSALMTTTVRAMEETVALVHERAPLCKVTVGGAVLTAEYAARIGADHYSRDAMGLVRFAESVFPRKA